MSSTSIWKGPESYAEEAYPSSLLKHLLKQMMARFTAQGACIALFDESIGRMVVRAHVRLRTTGPLTMPEQLRPASDASRTAKRRITVRLNGINSPPSQAGLPQPAPPPVEAVEEVLARPEECFVVGSAYAFGEDLIGSTWQRNEVQILNHEEYLETFHTRQGFFSPAGGTPAAYLAIPVQEMKLVNDIHGCKYQSEIMGVVVLYQFHGQSSFSVEQCADALRYVERVALYLQNDKLQRAQRRTAEHLERLKTISASFPESVKLADLIENMYRFASSVVDISSMLLTLYDRDTNGIYDVFAVRNGKRVEGLVEQPSVTTKEERPVWWQVTQNERRTLHFSPARDLHETVPYHELLVGPWGDQQGVGSFLFLPMKMFNRSTGSLSLTSRKINAYHPEEIQVLETMVQIVTVSIENAKLYDRDRRLLHEAEERESQLAAMNSALQTISLVLNAAELLNAFVEKIAILVKSDLCVFFQPSANGEELGATAMYGPSSFSELDDGSDIPAVESPRKKDEDEQLTKLIHIPFKDTFLEPKKFEGFFYLEPPQLDALAQRSSPGGAILLCEIPQPVQRLLMIPLSHQSEFMGYLAVLTPKDLPAFRPKEIGVLLAICAQATSAIRNAQLFEQREEAYAELQKMSNLKDEFLVTASHELRTPLSAIIGYSSLLKRQSARILPQQILRFAMKISGASQQLHDLLDHMTDAAKMGAFDKNLDLTISPVQVYSAAEMAANMLALRAEHKIIMHVDAQLWILGDPLHFRQVLSNLLDNAAKYSSPDSEIILSATPFILQDIASMMPEDQLDHALMVELGEQPIVLIRVEDHGEGISPEDQERIFEKFVRAPRSLTTSVRGSGLGLYICRRYVEAMGGKLWLERSVINEGSVMSFYLPRVEPPVDIGDTGEQKQL